MSDLNPDINSMLGGSNSPEKSGTRVPGEEDVETISPQAREEMKLHVPGDYDLSDATVTYDGEHFDGTDLYTIEAGGQEQQVRVNNTKVRPLD
ncbi:MAG: hypothetical protein ABEJ91_03140 [Candidatus Nanohaloarchaea archaeon]